MKPKKTVTIDVKVDVTAIVRNLGIVVITLVLAYLS
jgi:hypothetical protein